MNGPSNTAAAPPRTLGTPAPNALRQGVTRFQALVASCSAPGWETRLRDRLVLAPGPFKGQSKAAEEFVKTYSRAPAAERAFLWLQFDLAQPACPSTAQELGARLVDFAQHPYARSGGVEHLAAEVTRRTRDTGEFTEVVHRIYDAARQDGLPATQYGPLLLGVARGVLEARTSDKADPVPGQARTLATLLLEPATDPQAHWPCIHIGLTQLVDVCTGKAPPVAGAVAAVVACLDEALAQEALAAKRRQDLDTLRKRFPAPAVVKPRERMEWKPVVVTQPGPERPQRPVSPQPPPPTPDSKPEIDSKHVHSRQDFESGNDSESEDEIDSGSEFEPASDVDAEPDLAPPPALDPESESDPEPESEPESHSERVPASVAAADSDSAPGSDVDSERSVSGPHSDSKRDSDSDSDSADRVSVTVHTRRAPAKLPSDMTPPRSKTHKVLARQPAHPASTQARPESMQPAFPAVVPEPARPQAPPQPAAKPAPQNLHHLTPALAESLWLSGAFQQLRLPDSDLLEQHDAHYIGAYLAQWVPDGKMPEIARHMWTRSQSMKQPPAEWLGRFYAGWVETWAPGASSLLPLRAQAVSETVFANYQTLVAPRQRKKDTAGSDKLDLQLVTCLNAVAQKLSPSSGRLVNEKIANALRAHIRPEHVQRDFLETVTSAGQARTGAARRRPEPPGRDNK